MRLQVLKDERQRGQDDCQTVLKIRQGFRLCLGGDFFQEIRDGLGLAGEDSCGGDVGEGLEDEGSLGDSGVGKG